MKRWYKLGMVTSKISVLLLLALVVCGFLTGCQSARPYAGGTPAYAAETEESPLAGTAADDYARVLAYPGRF